MAQNGPHDICQVIRLAAIYPRETECEESMKGLAAYRSFLYRSCCQSKHLDLRGDTMLIEQTHTPEPVPTDPSIPEKFYTARDAAKLVCGFALAGNMVNVLQTFRRAHNSGFTIAAVCERACGYVARSYDYTPEERKQAIMSICERATKIARIYGELRRNRRYEWR